jgi:hypothetical protein
VVAAEIDADRCDPAGRSTARTKTNSKRRLRSLGLCGCHQEARCSRTRGQWNSSVTTELYWRNSEVIRE